MGQIVWQPIPPSSRLISLMKTKTSARPSISRESNLITHAIIGIYESFSFGTCRPLERKAATGRGLVTALDTLFTQLLNNARNAWPEPMQRFRRHSIPHSQWRVKVKTSRELSTDRYRSIQGYGITKSKNQRNYSSSASVGLSPTKCSPSALVYPLWHMGSYRV